jgi:hypothetical protein
MRDRFSHPPAPAASRARGGVLLVTVEGPAARVSLVCSDPSERRRLEPLVGLVRAVVDASLERGIAGPA